MAYTYYVLLILVSTSIAFGEERRDDDNTSTLEDNVQLLQELVYRQGSDIGRLVEDSKVVLMMLMQQQQEQREQMNGLERQQQEMQELLQDHHRQLMMSTAALWCRGNQIGLTTIYVRNQPPLVVPCDGKQGIVILRRIDGLHFTDRMWDEFKNGFGDKMQSFFIGLETIHLLTSMYECTLKVELEDWEGETRIAHYQYVHIEDENSGYRLKVSNFEGNAGDSLADGTKKKIHNGQKFSTPDRDQDAQSAGNCAKDKHAGWWFNACSSSNLAGQYFSYGKHNTSDYMGLYWVSWRGSKYSLKRAQMTLILR